MSHKVEISERFKSQRLEIKGQSSNLKHVEKIDEWKFNGENVDIEMSILMLNCTFLVFFERSLISTLWDRLYFRQFVLESLKKPKNLSNIMFLLKPINFYNLGLDQNAQELEAMPFNSLLRRKRLDNFIIRLFLLKIKEHFKTLIDYTTRNWVSEQFSVEPAHFTSKNLIQFWNIASPEYFNFFMSSSSSLWLFWFHAVSPD